MIKVRHFISTIPHEASQRRADDYYELLKTNTQAQSNHATIRPTQTEKQTTKQHGWVTDVAWESIVKIKSGIHCIAPWAEGNPSSTATGRVHSRILCNQEEHHNRV